MATPRTPRYWAGTIDDDEFVDGGVGNTPEEALHDYIQNHADQEADDSGADQLQVKIYTTLGKDNDKVPCDQWMEDWEFIIDEKIETVTIERGRWRRIDAGSRHGRTKGRHEEWCKDKAGAECQSCGAWFETEDASTAEGVEALE